MRRITLLVLTGFMAGVFSCAAPMPKWLVELEAQKGAATYEDVVSRWGPPAQLSKQGRETIGVWSMEEVVRPNWSIHTALRTVVCEKHVRKAEMWFDGQQRLARIEYLPDSARQRLGEANIPIISSLPGDRSVFYNYTNDDIRRMCMLDMSCSRIAEERCNMLARPQTGEGRP